MSSLRRHKLQIGLDFGGGIGGAHERLADEHGIGSGIEHALGVCQGFDAGFTDQQDIIGHFADLVLGGGEVDGEGFQIPVVDADQIGAEIDGAFHFA